MYYNWFKSLFGSQSDAEPDDDLEDELDKEETFIPSAAHVALNPPTLPLFPVSKTPFMSIACLSGSFPQPSGSHYRLWCRFLDEIKILAGLYKEVGIEINFDNGKDYFVVDGRSFQNALEKLKHSDINIDERIKAMSNGTPYR
jgi:hypothetical protein